MSPQISYFFKRIYGNIIKWWFVIYNPIVRRIWPTKQEEEIALEKEKEEEAAEKEQELEEREMLTSPMEDFQDSYSEDPVVEGTDSFLSDDSIGYEEPAAPAPSPVSIDDCNYNATTGAFSGLYGTKPVDSDTQSMLDEIMGKNASAHSIDSLIPSHNENTSASEPAAPSDQDAILAEANAIYERLLREAAQDEAAKQAEIDAAKAAQN